MQSSADEIGVQHRRQRPVAQVHPAHVHGVVNQVEQLLLSQDLFGFHRSCLSKFRMKQRYRRGTTVA
jgi:hypothetical protein